MTTIYVSTHKCLKIQILYSGLEDLISGLEDYITNFNVEGVAKNRRGLVSIQLIRSSSLS